ncbi:MAG: HDOD domain-containing protein [Candidatus Delongbacteria bacterium]|nr:HDOD domain-containing protein [Candidatus Delongbacteria bacterium]MBN2835079.1 HDOD domain-containing protein [Candidatus Delongbacteria bacterium]
MNKKELTSIIKNIKDLPTLPNIIIKIIAVVNDPLSSANDIKKLIENDYVQTARVLKLVNSSFYGFSKNVSKVTTAIVIIGYNEIKNLLISCSVYDVFKKSHKLDNQYFDMQNFMDHSLGTAICARMIGEMLKYNEPEELFVGGLLHDIGKIILYQYFHEDFIEALKQIGHKVYFQNEREFIGFTHNEIGLILTEHWSMPEKIRDMVTYHHYYHFSKLFKQESAIIYLADSITRTMKIGEYDKTNPPIADDNLLEFLGVNEEFIMKVMESLPNRFIEVKQLFESY